MARENASCAELTNLPMIRRSMRLWQSRELLSCRRFEDDSDRLLILFVVDAAGIVLFLDLPQHLHPRQNAPFEKAVDKCAGAALQDPPTGGQAVGDFCLLADKFRVVNKRQEVVLEYLCMRKVGRQQLRNNGPDQSAVPHK